MSKQPARPYFAVRGLRSGNCCTSSYMSIERVEKEIRHRWKAGSLIDVTFKGRTDYRTDTGIYYIVNVKREVFKKVDLNLPVELNAV